MIQFSLTRNKDIYRRRRTKKKVKVCKVEKSIVKVCKFAFTMFFNVIARIYKMNIFAAASIKNRSAFV